MLGLIIGLLPLGLGIKAFTRDGLPLTRSKNIKGAGAKAIGVGCILVGLLFIGDGAFSVCWHFASSAPSTSPHPSAHVAPAIQASNVAWVKHESKEGGYAVLMPGTPNEEGSPANPAIGKIGGHMSILEVNGSAYLAQCSRFSQERSDTKKELDAARDNIIAMLGGELQREQDMELADYPGREVFVSLPDGTVMRARYFVALKDVFQVMAVVPSGQESSKETTEFFDSFQLLGN